MKAFAFAVIFALSASAVEARPLRVMALDQCADQYVLALAPDADLALTPRADDRDSWMRRAARDHQRVRPTLEAAVAFQPDVVVRYWGGDARLLRRLDDQGVRVVTIQDATDFDGVRANIAAVSAALGRPDRGRTLAARMDENLARARGKGQDRSAAYLTSGGFTAGAGVLIDAVLKAAGFVNAVASPGFGPLPVERIALQPPARFVLGFFDQSRADWRGAGRHPLVRRAARGRTVASLPAAALTCPAWFAADAAVMLGQGG